MPKMFLTKPQLNHILKVYAEVGGDAARELAPRYGIKPVYVKKLASIHGVKVKRKEAKGPRESKKRINWEQFKFNKTHDAFNPRWEKAIKSGPVLV